MERANPLDICFTVLKIRYADYDRTITEADFIHSPDEKVNVFLNLESVFKNLTTVQDLEQKLITFRGFETNLASNIINLAGHYKRFFRGNHIRCNLYLYHTDFQSEEFKQCLYNENFRSYYNCKYTQNPKFIYLTDALQETVLPTVRTCCEFISGVDYICTKNIEGSSVPYIIDAWDRSQGLQPKNFIISNELYDTQYNYLPNFLTHYIKRGFGTSLVSCDKQEILAAIAKCQRSEAGSLVNSFDSHGLYATLLSCLGNKERSIDKLSGLGIRTVDGLVRQGKAVNRIQESTTSPAILSEIFQGEEVRTQFCNNYLCTSIPEIYTELTDAERLSITGQKQDRFDNQGLMQLNATLFQQYPLTLESLCM